MDAPDAFHAVSASWHEERGEGEAPFITQGRVHDLVVMGRFTRPNGLPPDLLPLLLVACGRPVLIAGPHAPRTLTGTVMVCWKDAPEPARALTAAMPLLTEAERVVVAAVDEGTPQGMTPRPSRATWHGTASAPRRSRSSQTAVRSRRCSHPRPRPVALIFW